MRRRFPLHGQRLGPLLLLLVLVATSAEADVRWMPRRAPFPRRLADPQEPHIGLTYLPDPDRFDASLGSPLPIATLSASGWNLAAVLEAGAFFRLGKRGSFFPLETFDGRLGLGLESVVHALRCRLRLAHWSAHRADGDSTVAYRGHTFSREFWTLEVGTGRGPVFVSAGVGSSWHAIPADPGAHLLLTGSWRPQGHSWRPFLAFYLAGDAAHNWRIRQSMVAGWETGTCHLVRLGVRYFNGNGPRGQYWTRSERFLGLDLEFSR